MILPLKVLVPALAATLALAFGWVWLCVGVRRQGWRSYTGAVAIQLSFVVLVFGLLDGHGLGAILDALLAPLFYASYRYYGQFPEFLSGILPCSIAAGLIAGLPFLAVRGLRRWCVAPAVLVALATGIVIGERISRQAMCREAAAFGISSFPRNGLLWSLANTPDKLQFEIHATFEKDGKRYGWSYRKMGWYEIPRSAWGEVYGPLFMCPTG